MWQVKAAQDGLKSLLPFNGALRRIVRAARPYRSNPRNDDWLLRDSVNQIAQLVTAGIPIRNADVVEIGTGWVPVLPLLYARCGAAKVITVDQERLLDRHTVLHALRLLERGAANLAPLGDVLRHRPAHAPAGLSEAALLRQESIEYRAPDDVRRLPDACADIVISRDVLEHVPENLLRALLQDWRRLTKPSGILCHTIDMSDHWEHGDKSISRVNFLRYEGLAWRLAGLNVQNYQNRLRRYEYLEMFAEAGFEILAATGDPDPRALRALDDLPLCARYRGRPKSELAILQTTVIARKLPR